MEEVIAAWFAKAMWSAMNNNGLAWMALPDDMRNRMVVEATGLLAAVGVERADELSLSEWKAGKGIELVAHLAPVRCPTCGDAME